MTFRKLDKILLIKIYFTIFIYYLINNYNNYIVYHIIIIFFFLDINFIKY